MSDEGRFYAEFDGHTDDWAIRDRRSPCGALPSGLIVAEVRTTKEDAAAVVALFEKRYVDGKEVTTEADRYEEKRNRREAAAKQAQREAALD